MSENFDFDVPPSAVSPAQIQEMSCSEIGQSLGI